MKHFRLSILVTVILMAVAGWWGFSRGGLPGMLTALWIAGSSHRYKKEEEALGSSGKA